MINEYDVNIGNHCTVRDGHVSACVTQTSYRYGTFFFHTLCLKGIVNRGKNRTICKKILFLNGINVVV